MAVNDPIADFLTRGRNAHMAKHETVEIPHSKMKAEISRILLEEGYVRDVTERGSGVEKRLVIALKYGPDGSRGDSRPEADEPPRTPRLPQAEGHPPGARRARGGDTLDLPGHPDRPPGQAQGRRRRSPMLRLLGRY